MKIFVMNSLLCFCGPDRNEKKNIEWNCFGTFLHTKPEKKIIHKLLTKKRSFTLTITDNNVNLAHSM